MKPHRLNIAFLAFGFALMALAGCAHKKPVLVAPQQIPTAAAPEATPTPEAAQPSDNAQAPQDAQAQPTPQDQTKAETAGTDKSKPKKPSPRKTGDKPVEVAKNGTHKTIVKADKTEPNPPAGPIVPGPTSGDAAHNQAATDQLLKTAQANLNAINRELSKEEEGKRSQVLEFISQSQKATNENDPSRAYNLALKARLLSDELVKQR
ncbi:MAG TPA: hypothetical protein VJW20_02290 [Candidatus Angelobacter sp.]|nr:hypothetical protein [Candidatus Angelobacter sp.]